jgi:hypothetical protein
MVMPGRHIRTFISWLRVVFKTTAVRSYTDILSALSRLIRYCYVVASGPGKARACRERGLALSSQADKPAKLTASVTLAVPILQAPLHSAGCQLGMDVRPLDEGSHSAAFTNQAPQNSCSPLTLSSGSEYDIYATLAERPVPGQSLDTTLMPITPRQIGRYDKNVKMYANFICRVRCHSMIHTYSRDEYVAFEIEKGPFDCSK